MKNHKALTKTMAPLQDSLRQIYKFTATWHLARSLISLFIPYYLYSAGVPIKGILGMYLAGLIAIIPVNYITGYLIATKGYKLPFVLSIPFKLATLFLLWIFPTYRFPVEAIGIANSTGAGFSDITRNILFASNTEQKKRGSALSFIESFTIVGTFLGPIAGGIIYELFGFVTAIFVSAAIMLLSLVFLSRTRNYPLDGKYRVFRMLKEQKNLPYVLISFFQGPYLLSAGTVYPLFLATLVETPLKFGLLGALSPLALIIFSVFIGRRIDLNSPKKLLALAGVLLFLEWMLKAFVTDILTISILLFLGGFIGKAFHLPKRTLLYNRAEETGARQAFLVLLEQVSYYSRILVLAISLFMPNPLQFIFVATALSMIYFIVFNRLDTQERGTHRRNTTILQSRERPV